MSARPDTWMPLYIGDYLADTGHLSAAEHGAYLLLIMAYWRNGGPIVDDDDELCRTARMDRQEWKRSGLRIRRFFTSADGLLHHGRIDGELKGATEITSKRRAAANARWAKGRCKVDANACAKDDPGISPSQSPMKEERETRAAVTIHRGWLPNQETLMWVALRNIPDAKRDAMIEHFIEHHLGKGTTFADHDAAFRTWVIRNPQFAGRANESGGTGRGRRPDNGFASAVGEVLAGSSIRGPHDG